MGKKRILISGAGVAGMVCAILLDREKYEVKIIEKADQFRNIGFSLILWKTGFDLLSKLLQEHDIQLVEEKDCYKVEESRFLGDNLQLLKKFEASGFGWAFERKHLMGLLEKVLLSQISKNQIHFSTTIQNISYENSLAQVKFSDDSSDEYDMVIIAEGINSSSRKLVPLKEKIVPVPYSIYYSWFNSPTNLGKSAGLFFKKDFAAVIHPPYFKNLLGFYFETGMSRERQMEFVQSIQSLIKQPGGQNSMVDTQAREIFDLIEVHLKQYYFKNVVFIGDAAHGRPPTLGFGTSFAIEDAVLLSRKINSLEDGVGVEEAFKSFSDVRTKRVKDVYFIQDIVQNFYTKSQFKVFVLSILIRIFGKLLELKVKQLASYKI